jgi:hypothetical protein
MRRSETKREFVELLSWQEVDDFIIDDDEGFCFGFCLNAQA